MNEHSDYDPKDMGLFPPPGVFPPPESFVEPPAPEPGPFDIIFRCGGKRKAAMSAQTKKLYGMTSDVGVAYYKNKGKRPYQFVAEMVVLMYIMLVCNLSWENQSSGKGVNFWMEKGRSGDCIRYPISPELALHKVFTLVKNNPKVMKARDESRFNFENAEVDAVLEAHIAAFKYMDNTVVGQKRTYDEISEDEMDIMESPTQEKPTEKAKEVLFQA